MDSFFLFIIKIKTMSIKTVNPAYISIGIGVFGLVLTILDMAKSGDPTGNSMTLLGNIGLIIFFIGLLYVPGALLYLWIKSLLAKK